MAAKRVGILTGGGDVPGLNSVIKSVVYRGSEIGCEITGIRRGWEGLTHVNLEDPASRLRYILPLNRDNTRTIDRSLVPANASTFQTPWPPLPRLRLITRGPAASRAGNSARIASAVR